MSLHRPLALLALAIVLGLAPAAHAVRLITDPATEPGDPPIDFVAFNLTPDGSQIIANARFNAATPNDRTYGLTIPGDLSTTITPTQLSTTSFLVGDYDTDAAPIISPNGSTVLYVHDGRMPDPSLNTIHTMPIAGESGDFNGLFAGLATGPNTVSPGNANFDPKYSPNGDTIFFINAEAGFGGTIPTWDTGSFSANDPTTFGSVWDDPDWDVLYSVPAAGGTPVAVTSAADGDLDGDLFAVTPNSATVVYAPDSPIATPRNRGDDRQTLVTVVAGGGASTAIPMTAAPNQNFTISGQLDVTTDGQNVMFIADYDTPGKDELYSVPIAGGTPTKINDELHFAGDVRSFALSPDGLSVAYAAGQTVGSSNELFFKSVSGAGTSVRISDPATTNNGDQDVSNGTGYGQIAFSPDSQTVYYLGDMTTTDAVDLYAVDTTAKAGLTPSAYTYVGADGGDFVLASNWEDADGNPLPADISTIDNQGVTTYSLLVDGDLIGGTRTVTSDFAEQIQFGRGGNLEIINGATVNLTTQGTSAGLDFDPGSGLKIVDGTLVTNDDLLFDGTLHLENGMLQSTGDDIEFQDEFDLTIINSEVLAADNLIIEGPISSVTGSTLTAEDVVSIRYDSDVTVVDTDITMSFDVEPVFTFSDGEGTSLTLKGSSTLTADSVNEGTDLILDDTSFASLGSLDIDPTSSSANPPSIMAGTNTVDDFGYVGEAYESQIIFMSTDAELELRFEVDVDESGTIDARSLIINGLTGMSYLDDPTAWNVTDWDGVAALALLKLADVAALLGDANGDGTVDLLDLDILGSNFGLTEGGTVATGDFNGDGAVDLLDLDILGSNFGATASATIPEPTAVSLLLLSLTAGAVGRRRVR